MLRLDKYCKGKIQGKGTTNHPNQVINKLVDKPRDKISLGK